MVTDHRGVRGDTWRWIEEQFQLFRGVVKPILEPGAGEETTSTMCWQGTTHCFPEWSEGTSDGISVTSLLIRLSVHPPSCQFIHPSTHFALHPSVHICPFICPSIHLMDSAVHLSTSVHPPVLPFIYSSTHLSVHLSFCVSPSICPSNCPSVHPPTCPSICSHLSICLSLHLSIHPSCCTTNIQHACSGLSSVLGPGAI